MAGLNRSMHSPINLGNRPGLSEVAGSTLPVDGGVKSALFHRAGQSATRVGSVKRREDIRGLMGLSQDLAHLLMQSIRDNERCHARVMPKVRRANA